MTLHRASSATAAPFSGGVRDPGFTTRCRTAFASGIGVPSQIQLPPLQALPTRHTPATGGTSAPPHRRAALPGAPGGRFMSEERDAGPAADASRGPACSAPLCRRGKLGAAESAAAAPLRSPADAGSASPHPPGMEQRLGAPYRMRVTKGVRRLPVKTASGFLSAPPSALLATPSAQR